MAQHSNPLVPMRKAQIFAEAMMGLALNANTSSLNVSLGTAALDLRLTQLDYLGDLIQGAFLPAPDRTAVARLTVMRRSDLPVLPAIHWAQPWINEHKELPSHVTYPYRIFFDRVVGLLYVLDQRDATAVIWVRDEAELDTRSFFTPFRIMFSWLANLRGAEVIHASGAVDGGNGIVFSGASGSGKSTLALALVQTGCEVVADDCLWIENDQMHALYARAKVDEAAATMLGLAMGDLHHLNPASRSKRVLSLPDMESFRASAPLNSLAFPTLGTRPGWYALHPRRAHRLLSTDSLREVMGGRARNHLRLARLTRAYPANRVILTPSITENLITVKKIARKPLRPGRSQELSRGL